MKKHLAFFGWSLLLTSSLAAAQDGAFYGSCEFKGQYASGCMEFTDGTWTDASMKDYCQSNSKEGEVAAVASSSCVKADFNAACVMTAPDGSTVSTYVNNMPSFICKKYMNGVLNKRPAAGW